MITYDSVIIGGGPAGISAALTCASQGLSCLLVAEKYGGKLNYISHLSNWFGGGLGNGVQLAISFQNELSRQAKFVTTISTAVTALEPTELGGRNSYIVQLQNDSRVIARSLVVATGTKQRQLGVPGEKMLLGKGVSYCATCDIPFFRNKTIALIGDNDRILAVTDELARHAKQVYLFSPLDSRAVRASNVQVIKGASLDKIVGIAKVSGLTYRDDKSKQVVHLALDGVFIESTALGNSQLVSHLVRTTKDGFIKVDHATMATSLAGVYAAGDVIDNRYKQVSIAVADGTKAVLSVKKYLNTKEIT